MLSRLLFVSLLYLVSVNCFVIPLQTSQRTTALSANTSVDPNRIVTTIGSFEEYAEFLRQDERLSVIKFHAAWCKSCQKFDVKYRHLASQGLADEFDEDGNLSAQGAVRFGEMEFGANARLCRTLGIKKLPSIHIYKGTVGLIADFPCGPSKFPVFEEKLQRYLTMSDPELELEIKLEEGQAMADQLASELKKQGESIASEHGKSTA